MMNPIRALHEHPVVRRVAEAARGVPCHLVGGMVRDAALDRPTKDVDVTVADRGEEIARTLAETLPARFVHLGGKAFPSYRLVAGDFEIDVWDREGQSLEADLARRDFTVNALALDLHDPEAEPVDPFGGLEDLRRRLLRATTPEVLRKDPLRVLRLARFLVTLPGFSAHSETVRLAREAAPGLTEVASERIREELLRILSSEHPEVGFLNMWDTRLYPGLFVGSPGAPASGEIHTGRVFEALHELVSTRSSQILAMARELGAEPPKVDRPVLHLVLAVRALFDAKGDEILQDLQDRGLVTRAEARAAHQTLHPPRLPKQHTLQCRWLHEQGDLWGNALVVSGTRELDRHWIPRGRKLIHLAAVEGDRIFDPPRWVTGDEVAEILGLQPGPELGQILADLQTAQVEGRVKSREEALGWLEAWAGEG